MQQTLDNMRSFFRTGATRTRAYRQRQLQLLKETVTRYEQEIFQALKADLNKSREECWVTENGFFLAELNRALRHLPEWMAPEKVPTNLLNFPSGSRIEKEPAGVVLIIGPWNYPFQLVLTPLIGAIAAGNCVVLKPSEQAPATSAIIQRIIDETFSADYIRCVQGDGAAVIGAMMRSFVFDHVFYTGSTSVGRIIYQMAAENLVPVTLELGGKSPCVVEADADVQVAARRIAMTKFSNAGQMCVAPDYVLVHASRREAFIAAITQAMQQFFGRQPEVSGYYGKIINSTQFNRIVSYLGNGKILAGGRHDASALFIEPTLMEPYSLEEPVMNEEIFGPVLPVITYETKEQALSVISKHPNPLAFYVFTASREKEREWLDAVPSGGACINNASWHLTNPELPFGGRGASGMGAYHGKYSFDTFSHSKSVLRTPTWFDPSMKYPPFKGKLRLFKWLIK